MWLKNLRNVSDHFKTLLDGDKTSAAQFVGGALDPDQSATIFDRRLTARLRLARRPVRLRQQFDPPGSRRSNRKMGLRV
jgi:hypothetical protein